MKEKLTQYVDLLFTGAVGCEDIKQEILQNTLDRYDDLIAEGRVPEAAYRLAITGIGDINEILGTAIQSDCTPSPVPHTGDEDTPEKKRKRALAIVLYILCPVPLLIFGSIGHQVMDILGICGVLAIVAFATYLMIVNARKEEEKVPMETGLRKTVKELVWTIALVIYFVISFATGDWYITWVIFLIAPAVSNLIFAILDLKEGTNHES